MRASIIVATLGFSTGIAWGALTHNAPVTQREPAFGARYASVVSTAHPMWPGELASSVNDSIRWQFKRPVQTYVAREHLVKVTALHPDAFVAQPSHRVIPHKVHRSAVETSRKNSGPNVFDALGYLPNPFSLVAQAPSNAAAGLLGGWVAGASWSLITTAGSVAIREHRELSNQEACQTAMGALPVVGMLPIWQGFCKVPADTCYHPEYVNYAGLRSDDPVGRFGHWVAWMQKYCKDVDWRKYADRAQYYTHTIME